MTTEMDRCEYGVDMCRNQPRYVTESGMKLCGYHKVIYRVRDGGGAVLKHYPNWEWDWRFNEPDYVYVFEYAEGSEIKVGRSTHPLRRISECQSETKRKLNLAAVAQSNKAITHEPIIHEALAEWHVHGEWFRNEPQAWRVIHQYFAKLPEMDIAMDRELAKRNGAE